MMAKRKNAKRNYAKRNYTKRSDSNRVKHHHIDRDGGPEFTTGKMAIDSNQNVFDSEAAAAVRWNSFGSWGTESRVKRAESIIMIGAVAAGLLTILVAWFLNR